MPLLTLDNTQLIELLDSSPSIQIFDICFVRNIFEDPIPEKSFHIERLEGKQGYTVVDGYGVYAANIKPDTELDIFAQIPTVENGMPNGMMIYALKEV